MRCARCQRGHTTTRTSINISNSHSTVLTPKRSALLSCLSALVSPLTPLTIALAPTGDVSCSSTSDVSGALFSECPSQTTEKTQDYFDPPIWWDYNIDELFTEYFDCSEILYGYEMYNRYNYEGGDAKASLAETKAALKILKEKYRKEVNLVPISEKEDDPNASTFTVPVEIGDAGPTKGRGIFASFPIKKGTLVMDLGMGNVGVFKDGHSWRKFAASLPRKEACNFIEWSWVQQVPPENEQDGDIRNGLTIFIGFDESNLINNAEWDANEGETANVRCGSPPEQWKEYQATRSNNEEALNERWGPCRFQYFASRDIAAGEEILLNYSEFEDVSQQGWKDIGL